MVAEESLRGVARSSSGQRLGARRFAPGVTGHVCFISGVTTILRRARRSVVVGNPISRWFRAIGLFVSQILDELRKVVRPTRSELWNYTLVVIVFVSAMMAMVALLDFGFTKLVGLVFGT